MPWKVERNEHLGFIELSYTGELTKTEVQESTAEALSLASCGGPYLFLSDISSARVDLSIMEIYDIPDQWRDAGASRSMKVALVVSDESAKRQDVRFYENVAYNSGWMVLLKK